MVINTFNPIEGMDVSFANYVKRRKTSDELHLIDGVPDYAFALDYELRKKILAIPHFYSICKKITGTLVTKEMQLLNQKALAVGPKQRPDIYQMGVECAKALGIGIPNIFILNNEAMNAYTIAADDTSPMVVLYNGIVERLTPQELKCVIAHECGHIHNNHTAFSSVINTIVNGMSDGIVGFVLSAANMALMLFWTRAAEITSDRAAVICADNPETAYSVNAKLLYGGTIGGNGYDINYDALKEQLDMTLSNPTKFQEIKSDHPSSIRRIFAEMAFAKCETYYKWRPEMRQQDSEPITRNAAEEQCRKLVNIFNN